jgi:hypothetical protein
LPPGIRTEADAVMLWNGGWIDVGGAPTAAPMPVTVQKLLPPILQNDPLAPLKQTVVAAIAAVPPVCQDLGVTGPQLIPIAEPGRTTMLVIGSGMWKWTELINPAIIPAESGHLDIQQAGSPSQKMDLPRLVTDRHPIVNGP